MKALANVAALLSLSMLAADAAGADSITFKNWLLECDTKDLPSCQLRQTLKDASGRQILQISARRLADANIIEVITPLSISIPYGVHLIFDRGAELIPPQSWSTEISKGASSAAQPKRSTLAAGTTQGASQDPTADTSFDLHLARCDPDGCHAVAPLDEKLMAAAKTAKRIAVRFQDSRSGKVLTIEASPHGFADGLPLAVATP